MKHFTLIAAALMALCTTISAQTVRVKFLSTSSQALNAEMLLNDDQPVQLSRILFAGYNSICLPLTLDAKQLQEAAPDVRVERLTGMRQEGDVLNLLFVDCTDEGIEAGVPYLIFSPKAQSLRARNTTSNGVSIQLRDVTLSDNAGNRITFGSSWEALQTHPLRLHMGLAGPRCQQSADQARESS